MSMTPKEIESHIYELNEQVVVNRVIVNTLIDIIVESGVKDSAELEADINNRLEKFRQNVVKRSSEIKKEESKKPTDTDFDRLKRMGVKSGEA